MRVAGGNTQLGQNPEISAMQQLIAVPRPTRALKWCADPTGSRMSPDSARLAGDGPPFDPADVPETLVLAADRLRLRVTWQPGNEAEIYADRLRAHCRCAWCTRARIAGTFAASFEGIAIERLTPIGGYAINIAFSDGHARGIYPWIYLRKIAEGGDAPSVAAPLVTTSLPFHDGSCA
jgi:prepilin-type processing-associated H-X9-DG protein